MTDYIKRDEENMCDNCEYDYCPQCADETMRTDMTDYIKHKEYKLPNGRTVTADFNELGQATITIQAMDALFDILNSSWEKSNRKRQQKTIDVVEVVRCKDCKYRSKIWYEDKRKKEGGYWIIGCNNDNIAERVYGLAHDDDFCSYGERAEE